MNTRNANWPQRAGAIFRQLAASDDRLTITAAEFSDMLEICNLTPNDFARLAGVNKSAVSRWINAVNPIPPWLPLIFEILDIFTEE